MARKHRLINQPPLHTPWFIIDKGVAVERDSIAPPPPLLVGVSRTIHTGVIRFDVSLGDTASLDHKSVPLTAISAEDGGSVEGEVQGGGELGGRVAEEAKLLVGLG